MTWRIFIVSALAMLVILVALERALPQTSAPTADVALVLAADVSASMKTDEVELQRKAYASALVHGDVWQAIAEGPHGRILLSYFEWSSCAYQAVVVKWTVVDSPGDLAAVAALILDGPQQPESGVTCIGGALRTAGALLATTPEVAERRIIDVSGDGTDNSDMPGLVAARTALLAAGVTINGLPIMVEPDLNIVEFYERLVMGGPGAFVIPVNTLHDLEPALRRKLVLEIG